MVGTIDEPRDNEMDVEVYESKGVQDILYIHPEAEETEGGDEDDSVARADSRESSEDNIGIHQEAKATKGDDEDNSDFPDDDDTGRDHHEAIHNYQ